MAASIDTTYDTHSLLSGYLRTYITRHGTSEQLTIWCICSMIGRYLLKLCASKSVEVAFRRVKSDGHDQPETFGVALDTSTNPAPTDNACGGYRSSDSRASCLITRFYCQLLIHAEVPLSLTVTSALLLRPLSCPVHTMPLRPPHSLRILLMLFRAALLVR